MMNLADVPATGLVQTGSRISYYLYAAGDRAAIAALAREMGTMLGRGERIDTLESGRPEVRASVERARRFLALTALLAAVLAGVAIALGTRRFVERHLDGCAVLRCLGATQAQLLRLHAGEFALLGFIACAIGALIGYGAQLAIGERSGWDDIAAAWTPARVVEPLRELDRARWAEAKRRAAGWIPELSALDF